MALLAIYLLVLVASEISEISSRNILDHHGAAAGSIIEMSNRGRDFHKNFKCPAIYGRYPVPEDCEYYFECKFGYPTLMRCNRGQLYDREQEQCRDNRKVTCHIGKEKEPHEHKDKEIEEKEDLGQFKCPYTWGTFAHPYDCSKYFVCLQNRPKLYHCNRNFLYDERIRKCLPRQKVNCGKRPDRDQITTKRPTPFTTTRKPVEKTTKKIATTTEDYHRFLCPFPNGQFSDPQDCSRYYECRRSIPHLYHCPKFTLYDERKRHCISEDHVKCGERPGGKDSGDNIFYCPFPNGRFPDPLDCSRYFECNSFVKKLYHCPKSTLYDERKEHCTEEKSVKCGSRPGGDDADQEEQHIHCPYVWGTFHHPVDCSKFIICTYGNPTILSCKKNELFHASYRRCLPKEKVSCDNRINPDVLATTTTSSFPTTTSTTAISITTTSKVPTTTTTVVPTTTTTPVPTTTTTTPVPTTTTTSIPTTLTTTSVPTTTTPVPTTVTPIPTTTLIPTTTTSSPVTTSISTTTERTTTTTFPTPSSSLSTDITTSTFSTGYPVTKPNTPPPTDCKEDDLECIIDGTGDVKGWFDCPQRFGHFPHGSSTQLFIHCDNWRPFVKRCAEKTVFSPQHLVCVWID